MMCDSSFPLPRPLPHHSVSSFYVCVLLWFSFVLYLFYSFLLLSFSLLFLVVFVPFVSVFLFSFLLALVLSSVCLVVFC